MKATDFEVMQSFARVCDDGWQQGWHERNGGNLTYRMTAEEVDQLRPFFRAVPGKWVQMDVQADNLRGEYFIATGSGKYFRHVQRAMQDTCCIVVFPGGVGAVPWMVPGGRDIALATSRLMREYDAAVWAHHGLFVSGPDFDTAFGLMHTIEKAAQIYMLVLASGKPVLQTITDDDLRAIAKEFGVTLREEFLD